MVIAWFGRHGARHALAIARTSLVNCWDKPSRLSRAKGGEATEETCKNSLARKLQDDSTQRRNWLHCQCSKHFETTQKTVPLPAHPGPVVLDLDGLEDDGVHVVHVFDVVPDKMQTK